MGRRDDFSSNFFLVRVCVCVCVRMRVPGYSGEGQKVTTCARPLPLGRCVQPSVISIAWPPVLRRVGARPDCQIILDVVGCHDGSWMDHGSRIADHASRITHDIQPSSSSPYSMGEWAQDRIPNPVPPSSFGQARTLLLITRSKPCGAMSYSGYGRRVFGFG